MEITRDNLDEFTAISQELTHIPLNTSEKLYLGGRVALNTYKNYGIDHLITLFEFNTTFNDIKHEIYNIIDQEQNAQQLDGYLDQITSSIHQSLSNGKNVCVHCKAGISRSSTVVIEYLIKYHNMGNEALNYVKKFRPIICPNAGFYRLLKQRNTNF
jgi:protein-tyrosine phosphatase